jgi:hypothetical protein
MASVSAFTRETKEAVLKRANFKCERCGVGPASQAHHRTPRRAGGSGNDELALPSNCIVLCSKCHDVVESRRKVAAQMGYLVGYGSHPVEVPVYLWHGWCYLNDDGTLERLGKVPSLNETRRVRP